MNEQSLMNSRHWRGETSSQSPSKHSDELRNYYRSSLRLKEIKSKKSNLRKTYRKIGLLTLDVFESATIGQLVGMFE